jgi:hypothetical protein
MSRLDGRLKRLETKKPITPQAMIDRDNPVGWIAVNGLGDREFDREKAWVFNREITLLSDEGALWLVPKDVLADIRKKVAEDPGTPAWMAWLEKRHVDEIAELEGVIASGDAEAMEQALTKRYLHAQVGDRGTQRALEDQIESLKGTIELGYTCPKDLFIEHMREHVAIQKARHGIVEKQSA